jgi:hypothetical protein
VQRYIWSRDLIGGDTWTIRNVVHKFLENLQYVAGERWGRSFGLIASKKVEILIRIQEERNNLHTIKRRKAN